MLDTVDKVVVSGKNYRVDFSLSLSLFLSPSQANINGYKQKATKEYKYKRDDPFPIENVQRSRDLRV